MGEQENFPQYLFKLKMEAELLENEYITKIM